MPQIDFNYFHKKYAIFLKAGINYYERPEIPDDKQNPVKNLYAKLNEMAKKGTCINNVLEPSINGLLGCGNLSLIYKGSNIQ